MKEQLNVIKEICGEYKIHSLEGEILAIENLLSGEKIIDVAVLGQFKAGKSSFLNALLETDILPVGVIPLTSIITRISYGDSERAEITFFDMSIRAVDISDISEYVSESGNPENRKGVLWADIYLPSLKKYRGLRFVDTPGLGSIFRHNSEVTEKWAPEIGVAIVAISSDRPMGESEIALIKETEKYSPEIVILLTKIDLYLQEQIKEITGFIEKNLRKEFNREYPLLTFSKKTRQAEHIDTLASSILMPLINNLGAEHGRILKYKLGSLAESSISYLKLSLEVSRKSDRERSNLKSLILGEKLSSNYLRVELKLLMGDYLNRTRENVYSRVRLYREGIISSLSDEFLCEYPAWGGDLYKISRRYEQWMNEAISREIKKISNNEKPEFMDMADDAKKHFSFFIKSFRERLNNSISSVLGITIRQEEWAVEVKEIKAPDVIISRASDLHLDMLWFLFPMFIFRNIFKRYFIKQIPYEIDKNLYRFTSNMTGLINKSIEEIKDQTYRYITAELSTIESILDNEKSRTVEIENSISEIKGMLKFTGQSHDISEHPVRE